MATTRARSDAIRHIRVCRRSRQAHVAESTRRAHVDSEQRGVLFVDEQQPMERLGDLESSRETSHERHQDGQSEAERQGERPSAGPV